MLKIKTADFEEQVEKHTGLVIIDLYADWCMPCKMLAPVLSQLEEEYPEIKFCKINVDEEPELAKMFRVQSIPMVAFVKNDIFLDMIVGLSPKGDIEKMIKEYM